MIYLKHTRYLQYLDTCCVHVASRLLGKRRPIQSPRIDAANEDTINRIATMDGDKQLRACVVFCSDSDEEDSEMRVSVSISAT